MSKPDRELADAIFRERIRRAREMPPEEKLADGWRLFERACRIMADGIRNQFPEADERRVQEILRERVELNRRVENPGWPQMTQLLP